MSAFSGLLLSDIAPHSDVCLFWSAAVRYSSTLWPSLSSTFLQTHPDLVTPPKGHLFIWFPRSCPSMLSAPSKRFGTNKTVGATWGWSIHLNMRCIRPGWEMSSVSSHDFGLICAGVSNTGTYKTNAWHNLNCLLHNSCHLITNEKLSVSRQFSETCGIISGGSGWRKTVVNQCLEFDTSLWQNLTVYVYQDESMLQQKMETEKKSREEEHAASVMVVLTRIDGDSNITDVFVKVRVVQSPSVNCFFSESQRWLQDTRWLY